MVLWVVAVISTRRWIIGRGLLGSAVERMRADRAYRAAIDWSSPESAIEGLSRGVNDFMSSTDGDWEIYWCAGRGVTSTPRPAMQSEGDVFDAFVQRLIAQPSGRIAQGRVFLASSVGGAYAGSAPTPFTELTPTHALSAYGEVKLRMEATLERAADSAQLRAFVARITNLYGPGQDLGKGQGLISVIVESYVTGRPVSVYVPLDTLRDYIYVDDCARVIDAGMRRLSDEASGAVVTKIVGAMSALSIGAIIGEMSRLRRKPVPIVLGQGDATGQAGDLRVRSIVWPDLDALVSTTLPEGLGAIYRAQLAAHMLPT